MATATMKAKDSVSGSLARCFVTIDGNRYNFMQMIDFEAKLDKTKVEVPILGRMAKGNKAVGVKITWTGTAHYNQSVMRKLLKKFAETGEDTYFDIQVENEDPTSAVGVQIVTLTDCNIDGGVLAKFDANSDTLTEEISGTAEGWDMPEEFELLDGME